MRTSLKTIGAAGLAAATIVSGLSFGTAAATAAPAGAAPAATTVAAPFVLKLINFAPMKFDSSSKEIRTANPVTTPTYEAAAAVADTWNFPAVGTSGKISYSDGDCLYFKNTNSSGPIKYADCDALPSGSVSNFTLNADGNITNAADSRFRMYLANAGGTYSFLNYGPVTYNNPLAGPITGLPFNANVRAGSVDVGGRSAVLEGRALAGSQVIINDNIPVTVQPDGTWSKDLTGLKLGKQDVKVEQWKDGARLGEPITVSVDLAVTTLDVDHFFATDIDQRVKVFGTADKAADVVITTPDGREVVAPVGTDGTFDTTLPAPNKGGDYTVKIAQRLPTAGGGSDTTTPIDYTINYGAGVSIVTPPADDEHTGGPVTMNGRGQAGSTVTVTEQGKPDQVIGEADVLANGLWNLTTTDLDDSEHVLVASQKSKGQNTTTAQVTINPGKSNIAAPPAPSPSAQMSPRRPLCRAPVPTVPRSPSTQATPPPPSAPPW